MCSDYETLVQYAFEQGVQVIEYDFTGDMQGYYCDGYVFIDKSAKESEKTALLAEELGHYYTACQDITETNTLNKSKQEAAGRHWAIQNLVPIENIINSIIGGCNNLYEISEHLDLPMDFLNEALTYYNHKIGSTFEYGGHLVTLTDGSLIVHPIL